MNLDRAIILSLFGGYTLKAGILGASIADAVIILGLAATYFLFNHKIDKKELAILTEQIEILKKSDQEQLAIISEVRTNVTGIKLGNAIKKVN